MRLITTFLAAIAAVAAMAQAPAFPGAEGHGRYITGGRGGEVRHVTNLNDSGSGSLRAAVTGNDKKIVVFDVAGIIALKSDLTIGANTTIEGQTAPYPGITLRYYTVLPNNDNIIIRFIRSRRGEERDVNDSADAIWTRHHTGMILDHCSFSWSIDEVASFYDNNNFTMQWCTLGESLNDAGHGKGAHGYGGIWGGKLASFHHNMICHVNNRSPRFNGARYDWTGYTGNKEYSTYKWQNAVQSEIVDFRNCVVYNCGDGCYGGPGGGYVNMVNNYYKTGPAAATHYITTTSVANSTTASSYPKYWNMLSRYYISGNRLNNTSNADWDAVFYDDGATYVINGEHCTPDPNHYYGTGVTYVKNSSGTDCVSMKLAEPVVTGDVTTHTAATAYTNVLAYAGASLYRDAVDTRYMQEATNGSATYTGSVSNKAGRIDRVSDVGGYTLASAVRADDFDADNDGMADAWEQRNGGTGLKANGYDLDPKKWYTNIEVYCNSLVEDVMKQGNSNATTAVDEYYPTCEKLTAEEAAGGEIHNPDEVSGLAGQITWPLLYDSNATTISANISEEMKSYITNTVVAVGSNLEMSGNNTYGGINFSRFKGLQVAETSGNARNAITIYFKTAEGCTFRGTAVAFDACKIGTNNGKFDAKWQDDGGSVTLANGAEPNRNNTENGFYSHYSYDITSQTADTDGTCSLTLNCYLLGGTNDSGPYYKELGFANIVISGVITNITTGVTHPVTMTVPTGTAYYNMAGQQVGSDAHGIIIERRLLPDGTITTHKVVR